MPPHLHGRTVPRESVQVLSVNGRNRRKRAKVQRKNPRMMPVIAMVWVIRSGVRAIHAGGQEANGEVGAARHRRPVRLAVRLAARVKKKVKVKKKAKVRPTNVRGRVIGGHVLAKNARVQATGEPASRGR